MIPGSIFKTVTLAAGLSAGVVNCDQMIDAPNSIIFNEGSVANASYSTTGALSVKDAFADSVNTVFAQIVLRMSFDDLYETARAFGFDARIAQDFLCAESVIEGIDSMTPFYQAWTGVGQAQYGDDGIRRGPLVTPVHMASLFAYFANGGILYSPYVVSSFENNDGSTCEMGSAAIAQNASSLRYIRSDEACCA